MRLLSFGIRRKAKGRQISYSFLFMRANGGQLSQITSLIEAGIIPVMDRVFPFEAINEALACIETGRSKGKVVVKLRRSDVVFARQQGSNDEALVCRSCRTWWHLSVSRGLREKGSRFSGGLGLGFRRSLLGRRTRSSKRALTSGNTALGMWSPAALHG
jgi:hypothetical protein